MTSTGAKNVTVRGEQCLSIGPGKSRVREYRGAVMHERADEACRATRIRAAARRARHHHATARDGVYQHAAAAAEIRTGRSYGRAPAAPVAVAGTRNNAVAVRRCWLSIHHLSGVNAG